MPYAERTKVPVSQSRNEIERTLKRYGADAFGYGYEGERAVVTFRMEGLMVRLDVTVPSDVRKPPQVERQRWRALALIVKAKLEAVEAGVTSFEEEFLPHILLPDGTRFGEWALPQIGEVYETGAMPSALPGVRGELPSGE